LAWGLGFFIFVESVIGVLVSGTITRPLFDKLRISREKLSYILDSTCAPKATIVPLNTWGAYIIGLLLAQSVESPVRAMVASIPFNFYCILAIVFALAFALSERDFGPMKEAERRVREEGKVLRDGAEPLIASDALMLPPKEGVPHRAFNMVFPVAAVLLTLPIVLYVTGNGNMMDGSGTLAAFWALIVAIVVAGAMYRFQGIMNINEVTDMFMKGIGALIPVGILLILAFGIGDVCRELGTGAFVARAAQAGLPAGVVPAALFVVAGLVSFSTGTSYGTWAIMIPIAIPMITLMHLNPSLTIASVLGGGIFGDHCSPISDSTIISSMAAGTDHIDHVRTQLPYALVVAACTLALYLVFGYVL
jgi:Na+/H+ antiporter NhaC